MRPTAALCAFIVIGVGMASGCGAETTSAPPSASDVEATPTPTSTAPVADVSISNFTYAVRGPVKPGQQVTVVNEDEASHSLAADANNAFDIRVSGGGGIETLTAPMTPGTYEFHCKYHANMHGMLIVQ